MDYPEKSAKGFAVGPSILLYEKSEESEVSTVETSMQQVTRWRFTVHDYHRMGDAGILHEDDRVELIEGEIVEMAAIGTRHFSCVNRLNRLLVMSVGDEAVVSVQNPVRLNEHTEPQPDLAMIHPRDCTESLPVPEDVLVLIEISEHHPSLRPQDKALALRACRDRGGLDRQPPRRNHRVLHRPFHERLPARRAQTTRTDAAVSCATRPDPNRGRSVLG
jgi:hypothetical protein